MDYLYADVISKWVRIAITEPHSFRIWYKNFRNVIKQFDPQRIHELSQHRIYDFYLNFNFLLTSIQNIYLTRCADGQTA